MNGWLCRDCTRLGLVHVLDATKTPQSADRTLPSAFLECSLCGEDAPVLGVFAGESAAERVCVTCLSTSFSKMTQELETQAYRTIYAVNKRAPSAHEVLRKHFDPTDTLSLVTSDRVFKSYARIDVARMLSERLKSFRCVGVHSRHAQLHASFAHLLDADAKDFSVGPLQYDEVNLGNNEHVRCLVRGLWLGEEQGLRVAITLSYSHYPNPGWHVEVCVPPGEQGTSFVEAFFEKVDKSVADSHTYRGKVLSREELRGGGQFGLGLSVVDLDPVERDELILPESTIALMERNIFRFLNQRKRMGKLGMSQKKGLLFYGPPGTGKTHTIRYLASQLKDHTTLLITAEQVADIDEYMTLARLLAPSLVVIEDVDLIARMREDMRSAGEEALLNKLLNEMDGLRNDTELLMVLTTNRPEALEQALAGRPGRIDQAIEFPLPDTRGRGRLVDLYRFGLELPDAVRTAVVERTAGLSAAFLKELMRRICLIAAERTDTETIPPATLKDLDLALTEMVESGGGLNARLLGIDTGEVGFS